MQPGISKRMTDMHSDDNLGEKITLASLELDAAQERRDGSETAFDLIGSLIFGFAEIASQKFGVIRFGVSKAIFELNFQGCRMRQIEQCFRRPGAVVWSQLELRHESTKAGNSLGLFSRLGIGSKGSGTEVSAEFGRKSEQTSESRSERHREVSTVRALPRLGDGITARYLLESQTGGPLEDDVFVGKDGPESLGVVRIHELAAWGIVGNLEMMPRTELVDTSTLPISKQILLKKEQAKKLSLANILLKREAFEHTELARIGSLFNEKNQP